MIALVLLSGGSGSAITFCPFTPIFPFSRFHVPRDSSSPRTMATLGSSILSPSLTPDDGRSSGQERARAQRHVVCSRRRATRPQLIPVQEPFLKFRRTRCVRRAGDITSPRRSDRMCQSRVYPACTCDCTSPCIRTPRWLTSYDPLKQSLSMYVL